MIQSLKKRKCGSHVKCMRSIKNICLPDVVTRVTFSCLEQQLSTICQFYKEQYWKIFLDYRAVIETDNRVSLEKQIKFYRGIAEACQKYYGIKYRKICNDEKLDFTKGQIYCAIVNLERYPFARNNEEVQHCIILYDSTEKGYTIKDHYYGINNFLYEYTKFKNAEIAVFEVVFTQYLENHINIYEMILSHFKDSFYDLVEQLICLTQSKKGFQHNSQEFIEMLKNIIGFLAKDPLILQGFNPENRYLMKCADILSRVVEELADFMYMYIKECVKYGEDPLDVLQNNFVKLLEILKVEKKVKHEIVLLLNQEQSLADRIRNQLKAYLNREIDETQSVFEDHDKMTILFLLAHWEIENHSKQFVYSRYKHCDTYGEYIMQTYENILMDEEAPDGI